METNSSFRRGFVPYAFAAFLIGIVGGFSTVLGPAFVQDIGISYSNTTWTALAQAMSTAACAPILGKLGDVVGRKRTLILGIILFTLGNVLSALANSLLFMLIARFIVGIGTAAMTPVIMAYIVTQFPPEKISSGFSLYMLISSGSVILGPTLGGLLVSSHGWRFMLWVCVAICIVILVLCLATGKKGDSVQRSLQHFDWSGAILVLIFFSLVLCIPSFGQNFGWNSGAFWGIAIAAGVTLAGLLAAEHKAAQPLLPYRFMRRGVFIRSVLILFLTQGLMQANMTNIIIFVRYTLPNNTTVSGYAISVMYLGMSLGAAVLGPLSGRVSPKLVLSGSLLLTAIGCGLLLLFSAATPPLLLMSSLGILGLGLGGNGTILMNVALSGLRPHEAGAGTGTYGLFRDLSAPFGVAVFVPLFTNQVADLIAAGALPKAAAVNGIHRLSIAELICILLGFLVVLSLPKNTKRNDKNATHG